MGMSSCISPAARQNARGVPGACRCAGCPRAAAVAEPLERPHKSSKINLKVLKKIKKKIGLGRSTCVGGSAGGLTGGVGLPPLGFHSCHGDNIRISRDGAHARRVESFCKGVVFSSRPVAVNEKICIRFTEMSTNWSGVLRFGFTSHDPLTMLGVLPKYACPDLTNKPGHWAKALAERLCDAGSILQYYVTSSGDVHFSVDGDDKGIFFSGVDTKNPLWALLDIYGNCTGIQFVDSRSQLNNARREPQEIAPRPLQNVTVEDEIERNLVPAMRNTTIADSWNPALLHNTCGKHIRVDADSGMATRIQTEYCHGYIFTARPLAPGERLMIKILETEQFYTGALALGLTSCDPAKLTANDLPDDSDNLLDRPEYWVVSKDVAGTPRVGEELILSVSGVGEVKVSRNGGAPIMVMHVDYSLRLWAFLDVYGSTKSVQVLSKPPPAVLVVALPPPHNATNHLIAATRASHVQPIQGISSSSSSSTTSLPLNAPLSPPSVVNHRNAAVHSMMMAPSHQAVPRVPSGNVLHQILDTNVPDHPNLTSVTCSNIIVNQSLPSSVTQPGVSGMQLQAPPTNSTVNIVGECTICYEQQIDSVLYMCGHMCMCYRCAVQQWRGKGGGQCPMCRAPIRDVIRTYKS